MTTPQDNGGPIAPSMIMRQQVAPDTFAESRMDAVGGLTLRDWFAGMALQGLTSNPEVFPNSYAKDIGADAYQIADAMLAARKEDA